MPATIPGQGLESQYIDGSPEVKSEISVADGALVHPDFRLWLTTRANAGLALPAVLIQYGIKVACEAKENFKESVRTNFRVLTGSLNSCTPVWGGAAENMVVKVGLALS